MFPYIFPFCTVGSRLKLFFLSSHSLLIDDFNICSPNYVCTLYFVSILQAGPSGWPSGESENFPNGRSNGRSSIMQKRYIIIIDGRGPVCVLKVVFQSQSRPGHAP